MAKPPKTPRPEKPPILPRRPDQQFDPTIGLIQEKLIGRVVVAWSKLEAAMDDLIWHLLKLEIENGRVVTTRLDAIAKIRMIRQLGELELTPAQFIILSPVLDEVDVLREDRNFVVHGSWGRSLPENVPIAVSLRPKWKPNEAVSETFPDKRMRAIVLGIELAKQKLIRLMGELRALPGRSTPRHHEG